MHGIKVYFSSNIMHHVFAINRFLVHNNVITTISCEENLFFSGPDEVQKNYSGVNEFYISTLRSTSKRLLENINSRTLDVSDNR